MQEIEKALEILRTYWGYDSFREGQWDIVSQILAGRDVLGVLPTGGGKSLCYQVPALMNDGVTLVLSPLIALMQDQVQRLEQVGVPAVSINSTSTPRDIDQAWTDVEFGRYRLVYMAPERIHSEAFQARVDRLNIRLVAIDEAHCISEWGHNFRPSYLKIAALRSLLPEPVPFAALTATATPRVQEDIRSYLQLENAFEFVQGFDRPEVTWSIFHTENKRVKVTDILKGVPGSGIIYAATRKSVEEWGHWLGARGEEVACYHGGLSTSQRERAANAWLTGEKRIMVATNAFGMGIDKPDVRFVIHVDMPGALESYYQEAGRAGRDNKRAYAVLLHQHGDADTQHGLIEDSHPTVHVLQAVYDEVCVQSQVTPGDFPDYPIAVNSITIGHRTGFRLPLVRSAVEHLARLGVWSILPVKKQKAQLRIIKPVAVLRDFSTSVQNEHLARFIEQLLRTVHGDAFTDWWDLPMKDIERKTKLDRARVTTFLDFLQSRELIEWMPPGEQKHVFLQHARPGKLVLDHSQNRKARKGALSRLNDMKRYVHSVSCRRHFLLKYFGESSPEHCGRCDVCLGRHEEVVITPEDEPLLRHLLRLIKENAPPEHWAATLGISQKKVDGYTRWLLQEEYITWAIGPAYMYALSSKARQFLEEWAKEQD